MTVHFQMNRKQLIVESEKGACYAEEIFHHINTIQMIFLDRYLQNATNPINSKLFF